MDISFQTIYYLSSTKLECKIGKKCDLKNIFKYETQLHVIQELICYVFNVTLRFGLQ